MPVWLKDVPDYDGVLLKYTSLPDGEAPYDLDMTGVHEIAHWLGLEHTFKGWDPDTAPEGGCLPPGDSIADTPYEASPAFGPGIGQPCLRPGSRNTCPQQAGADPINNYLDCADDRCMTTFTPGQIAWMKEQVAQHRPLQLEKTEGELWSLVAVE